MDPFADVLLHELSSIELIEDLAKDESIEDQGIPHLLHTLNINRPLNFKVRMTTI